MVIFFGIQRGKKGQMLEEEKWDRQKLFTDKFGHSWRIYLLVYAKENFKKIGNIIIGAKITQRCIVFSIQPNVIGYMWQVIFQKIAWLSQLARGI